METEIASAVAQFGVAGLIAWMWLSERRSAQAREGQIEQAHEQLREEREKVSVLVTALDQNTRALTSLEGTQRQMVDFLRMKSDSTLNNGTRATA